MIDEAQLTGESIPILKSSINIENVEKKELKKAILYSGTDLIYKKTQKCIGIAIGTGWNTSKGKLIGSVVFNTFS